MPGRRSLLNLKTVVGDTEIVVCAAGVLDISTVDALVDAVRTQLSDGRPVVVDVNGVSMCDSTGLGGIVSLERDARARQGSFTVRNPRRHVSRLIEMTGIDRVIRIDQTSERTAP